MDNQSREYINWVKAVGATEIAKHGLCNFVFDVIKQLQREILNKVTKTNNARNMICNACNNGNVLPCPTKDVCTRPKCKFHEPPRYRFRECPNYICNDFHLELKNVYRFNKDKEPPWKNTNATGWCTDVWEVAKCFLPPIKPNQRNRSLDETNLIGVISIIINCKRFDKHVSDDLNHRDNKFSKARAFAYQIANSKTLDYEQLKDYIATLKDMLTDKTDISAHAPAQDAVRKLTLLEEDKLPIFADEFQTVIQYAETNEYDIVDDYQKVPYEIATLDEKSIAIYKKALKDGKEKVHNIRVMIVGHFGVGKTTLSKRLLGDPVNTDIREPPTDGIEVHVRRCTVDEHGKWSPLEHEYGNVPKQEALLNRMGNAIRRYSESSDDTAQTADETPCKVLYERHDVKEPIQETRQKPKGYSTDVGIESSNPETKPKRTMKRTASQQKLLRGLAQAKVSNNSTFCELSIWDFAGHYVFYTTHQVFLTRRAVYLVVTDISKQEHEQVQDGSFSEADSKAQLSVTDYVDFWLQSIHEFCASANMTEPPVILVGTHADTYAEQHGLDLTKTSKEGMKRTYFHGLRRQLNSAAIVHVEDNQILVDNTINDENIDVLKEVIWEVAKKQSYWEEDMPLKWLELEKELMELRDDGLKVLSREKLRAINIDLLVPVETEDEIEVFLKFQHEIGNVIYFSDDIMRDFVLLEPQWLIDAFRRIISAENTISWKDTAMFNEWKQFVQSSKLTIAYIDKVWNTSDMQQHKDLLLKYMEKLSLISKPVNEPSNEQDKRPDYFFVPCILKKVPPENLTYVDGERDTLKFISTSKLCFTTDNQFIPTAVFHKLLAECIAKWPLVKKDDAFQIFCGYAQLYLKPAYMLNIYFKRNIIQLWILRLRDDSEESLCEICIEVRRFIKGKLDKISLMKSEIKQYFACEKIREVHKGQLMASTSNLDFTELICDCWKEHPTDPSELRKYWEISDSLPHPCWANREPTRRELLAISQSIGANNKLLAAALNVSKVATERILESSSTSVNATFDILEEWKQNLNRNGRRASLKDLQKAMLNSELTIEWSMINTRTEMKLYETDVSIDDSELEDVVEEEKDDEEEAELLQEVHALFY